jgi:predicted membrane protein
MGNVPSWAGWSLIAAGVLLSPMLALLMAIAIEILVVSVVEAGPPAFALVGAGGGLFLLHKLRRHPPDDATTEC